MKIKKTLTGVICMIMATLLGLTTGCTPDGGENVKKGEKIYDFMLNPPEVVAAVDHSKGGLNLPGQGNRKGKKDKQEETKANFDT